MILFMLQSRTGKKLNEENKDLFFDSRLFFKMSNMSVCPIKYWTVSVHLNIEACYMLFQTFLFSISPIKNDFHIFFY